jgi:hypothetical protein
MNESTDRQLVCKKCSKPLIITYDELRKLYHHHCECWDLFLLLAVNSAEAWKTAVQRFEAELAGNRPENLLVSSPEREARKRELRARLAKERLAPAWTVKSREQIEAENLSYWTCGGMSFLRRKYVEEAEKARQKRETKAARSREIVTVKTLINPKTETPTTPATENGERLSNESKN